MLPKDVTLDMSPVGELTNNMISDDGTFHTEQGDSVALIALSLVEMNTSLYAIAHTLDELLQEMKKPKLSKLRSYYPEHQLC